MNKGCRYGLGGGGQQIAQLEEASSVNKEEGLMNPHRHASDVHYGDVHSATAPEWLSPKQKMDFIAHHRAVLFYDLLTGG